MNPAPFIHFTWFLWIVLMVYWTVGAFKTKKTVRRDTAWQKIISDLGILFFFVLVFAPGWGVFGSRIVPSTGIYLFLGVIICLGGVLFAIWARYSLGSNWSKSVVLKEKHELITRVPYSVVRHPIYSGFLMAALGTTIVVGNTQGVIGLIIVAFGFMIKLLQEEKVMLKQFPKKYGDYKRKVPGIIPKIV